MKKSKDLVSEQYLTVTSFGIESNDGFWFEATSKSDVSFIKTAFTIPQPERFQMIPLL